jgi:hypothetical protein
MTTSLEAAERVRTSDSRHTIERKAMSAKDCSCCASYVRGTQGDANEAGTHLEGSAEVKGMRESSLSFCLSVSLSLCLSVSLSLCLSVSLSLCRRLLLLTRDIFTFGHGSVIQHGVMPVAVVVEIHELAPGTG